MKVGIIGLGYVGINLASAACEHFVVVGYDTDSSKISLLNSGKSYIEGITDSQIAEKINSRRFFPTSDPTNLKNCEIIVIAVPTPLTRDRKPDLVFIEAACKTIGENIKQPALVINESTSFPGTLRNYIKPAIERYSEGKIELLYAISPERVDPGRSDFDQKNTPRLYAGLTSKASEKTRDFYSKFCDNLVEVSSPEVAEAAKLFENTFRQVNIALVNEFTQIAHALGINVYETIEAANTKPYGFMKFTPSAGVGGHCIPVDPTYLAYSAENLGVSATLIREANRINLEMSKFIVEFIESKIGFELKSRRVQVIGVAYKSNVKDVRESPAELVINHLKRKGAEVTWHDDVVKVWNGEPSTPLGGAEIAIVVTKHDSLSAGEILMSAPFVFDSTGKVPGAKTL